MGNKKLITNEKGFTLIELLIAISVAVLLIVPTYRILIQGQAVQSKTFSQAGIQEKTQKVLNQIAAGAAAQGISGLRESSKVSYEEHGVAYIVEDKMFTYYLKDNALYFNSQAAPAEPQVNYSGGKVILNDVKEFTVTNSGYLYEIALEAGKEVAQGGKAEAAFTISVFTKNIKNEQNSGGNNGGVDDEEDDQSSSANLIDLQLSSGKLEPDFNTDITTYTAKVNKHTSTITVTPTLDNPEKATVTVNGKTVKSGEASEPIPLNPGDNTISVVVTGEDGTTKTYTIIVNRKNTNDNNGGGNDDGDDDDGDDDDGKGHGHDDDKDHDDEQDKDDKDNNGKGNGNGNGKNHD